MLDLSRTTIVIVDFPGACKLREHLLSTGASVHVVKPAAALVWAGARKSTRHLSVSRMPGPSFASSSPS